MQHAAEPAEVSDKDQESEVPKPNAGSECDSDSSSANRLKTIESFKKSFPIEDEHIYRTFKLKTLMSPATKNIALLENLDIVNWAKQEGMQSIGWRAKAEDWTGRSVMQMSLSDLDRISAGQTV